MATMSAVQQTTGYGPAASAANSIPEFSGDVKSFAYRAAMQSTDSDLWSAAVRAEIDSLVGNGTFQAVSEQSIPIGKKILTTPARLAKEVESSEFKENLVFDDVRRRDVIAEFAMERRSPGLIHGLGAHEVPIELIVVSN